MGLEVKIFKVRLTAISEAQMRYEKVSPCFVLDMYRKWCKCMIPDLSSVICSFCTHMLAARDLAEPNVCR